MPLENKEQLKSSSPRVLLVQRINRADPANQGVVKKCLAQLAALQQLSARVDHIWLDQRGMLCNNRLIDVQLLDPRHWRTYVYYFFRFGRQVTHWLDEHDYDLIYLRHPFFDPGLVKMLRTLQRRQTHCKVVLEINTFPYDAEPQRWLHRLSLVIDRYYRREAHHFIDRIAHYGEEDSIWGIPTIPLRNGVATANIPLARSQPQVGQLRLIAVGNWQYWHGLDRLLHALASYQKQATKSSYKVSLKIVGEGAAVLTYRKMVQTLNLESIVHFHPPASEETLDMLFDTADLGVGTLAMHRKGDLLDSSLKHREYCARGIPFILGSDDPDFPNAWPFVCHFPADESPLDLERIIAFWEHILKNDADFRQKMRSYAEANLSWRQQMQKVLNNV